MAGKEEAVIGKNADARKAIGQHGMEHGLKHLVLTRPQIAPAILAAHDDLIKRFHKGCVRGQVLNGKIHGRDVLLHAAHHVHRHVSEAIGGERVRAVHIGLAQIGSIDRYDQKNHGRE